MLVGHFGIAQFAKGLRRELPFALLLAAAYLPDLVRVPLDAITARNEVLSHSLPAIFAMAVGLAAIWLVRGGRPVAAGVLGLVCLLHWPADVFTGCKPTTFDGPWVGLISYRRPVNDLLLEGALLVGGWTYARRRGFAIWRRWLVIGFATQIAFLLFMYWGAQFIIGSREWTWHPHESKLPQPHVLEITPCRPPVLTVLTSFH